MLTDHPASRHIPQLRQLWQEAFGDSDAFLDSFFRTAFSPDRCLCIFSGDSLAAALYWMDCALEEQRLAYIYAVATRRDFRGRGLCRMLMNRTHELLARRGYAGAVLVPQQESLRQMYAGMDYASFGGLTEFRCSAEAPAVSLRSVGPEAFAALRRRLLPPGSVLQEGHSLAFLSEQLQFYSGADWLLAGYCEKGILHAVELLGNTASSAGIVAALGCTGGIFRTPGTEKPFAMFRPLRENAAISQYFGFAFD